MFRFMAFIWDAGDRRQLEAAQLLARQVQSLPGDWHEVWRRSGFSVWCAGVSAGSSRSYVLHDQAGVVLGTLFERQAGEGFKECGAALDEQACARIIASGGRELILSYWGRYVAYLCDPAQDRQWIIKDPTGRLPCYSSELRGVTLFYSCLMDAKRLDLLRFTVNWPYMTARVATGTGLPGATAVREVSEIYGGECIEFRRGGQASRSFYWEPIAISESDVIEDHARAARELRETAKASTHAWASHYGNILHRLSGGLDSSIVLGCLQDAPDNPRITCVTYYVPGGISDERPWARLAAQSAGCEHIEHPRDSRVNFKDLLRIAPLPVPPSGLSYLEIAPTDIRFARERGATAICTGDGGDSLFGRYGTRFALGDYVRRHGLRPGLVSVAEDAAMIRDVSVWKVIADTLRRNIGRELEGMTTQRLRDSRRLVAEQVFESAAACKASYEHPWFQSPRIPPAVPQRLALVTQPELFYNPLGRPEDPNPEPLTPLLSQPVVELCLRIPIYVHIRGGRDRSVARRAFVPDVPKELLARQWKDVVQGYAEQILAWNRDFIRELLLDGMLAKEKILDRKKLEENLSGLPAKDGAFPGELVDHVMSEAWLRTWSGGTTQQAAA